MFLSQGSIPQSVLILEESSLPMLYIANTKKTPYCRYDMRSNEAISLLLIVALTSTILAPVLSSFAQILQPTPNASQSKFDVIKTSRTVRFAFPYTASNTDRTAPVVYSFAKPIPESWIINIDNSLAYASRPDSKTVIKLEEPAPSDKFIEIGMYGDVASKRFWAAVNTKEAGYIRIYDKQGVDGWSATQPITVGYDSNQGLSVFSGTKVLVDRLSVNGFTLSSIAVYGKDGPTSPLNVYGGNISFEVLWGKPADSPIYYLPLAMLVGVGGVLVGLLVFKKRDRVKP